MPGIDAAPGDIALARGPKTPAGRVLRRVAAATLCFLSCAAIGLFAVYPWVNSTVTDLPFFLATGREICENGIPRINPFGVQEGLRIVVQQWLWDVAAYLLNEAGGLNLVAALAVGLASAATALSLAAWAAVRGTSVRRVSPLPAAPALAACLFFSLPWACARPHIATMCLMLAAVALMERWRRATEPSAWRRLWALPLVLAAHMQVHMAMAWLDVAVVLAYCLPEDLDAVKRLLDRETSAAEARRRLTPLAFAAISIGAMPLNPYGADGMAYLFNSAGAASYAGAILEMQGPLSSGDALGPWHALGICACSVAPLATGLVRARRGKARLRLDLSAFSLAAAAMTLVHVRNGWVCYVFGVAMWAWALDGVEAELRTGLGKGVLRMSGMLAALAPACALVLALGLLGEAPSVSAGWNAEEAYLDPMLQVVEEESGGKQSVVLCSTWSDLNWLEWRGWNVLVDARPEIWEPGISGFGEHLNREYFDAVGAGDSEFTEEGLRAYVERRGVDYVICGHAGDGQETDAEERYAEIGWLERIGGNERYTLYKVEL